MKKGYKINALSVLRKHIRWKVYGFVCYNFYDRKGRYEKSKDYIGKHEPKLSDEWEHIEIGVDEYENFELEEKYLKKKEPSVLFDPYYLGGRKENLW